MTAKSSSSGQQSLTLITPLAELTDGQEADFFALMTTKENAVTRAGKPYWKVGFRDAGREVNFPVWSDSPLADACRDEWTPGAIYKIRAVYRETTYGPQLDISKIREVDPSDQAAGFDETMFLPQSQFPPEAMFAELLTTAQQEIADGSLSVLVADILEQYRQPLLTLPAAVHHHHAFAGGYLEHVASVTRNAVLLADRYLRDYGDMQPPLSRDLVIAGAILHDIGKLRELAVSATGASYTPAGELIGHILLGRDVIREAATRHPLSEETLLRLEHIIVSHQRLPEWGSPKPPMTPEALIVHFADDLDAKFQMMYAALRDEPAESEFTSRRNPLQYRIFRGLVDAGDPPAEVE